MNRKQKTGLLWAVCLGMLIVSVMTTHVSLIVLGKRGGRFFDIAGQMIPLAWDYGAVVLQPL